jgi:hypothetical protein
VFAVSVELRPFHEGVQLALVCDRELLREQLKCHEGLHHRAQYEIELLKRFEDPPKEGLPNAIYYAIITGGKETAR